VEGEKITMNFKGRKLNITARESINENIRTYLVVVA
jgi:hypothetical protein